MCFTCIAARLTYIVGWWLESTSPCYVSNISLCDDCNISYFMIYFTDIVGWLLSFGFTYNVLTCVVGWLWQSTLLNDILDLHYLFIGRVYINVWYIDLYSTLIAIVYINPFCYIDVTRVCINYDVGGEIGQLVCVPAMTSSCAIIPPPPVYNLQRHCRPVPLIPCLYGVSVGSFESEKV